MKEPRRCVDVLEVGGKHPYFHWRSKMTPSRNCHIDYRKHTEFVYQG